MMSKWRSSALVLMLVVGAPAAALAQNEIKSINSSQQSGAEVVRIELTEALAAVPNGFTIQTPPRIAIDLPGVSNAMGRNMVEINQGNLRSVNVAQAGERTRLVFYLATAVALVGVGMIAFSERNASVSGFAGSMVALVMAICAGDSWIDNGANLILLGGPGGGKSHLSSAIGLALVENGWRVMFTRTSDLVQRLQVARRELALEAAIARLGQRALVS